MPSLATGIDESTRAKRAWSRIQRWSTPITVRRGATTLSAQAVRIVFSTQQIDRVGRGENTMPGEKDAVVFGVKNHPDVTILDTNLQRDDTFVIDNSKYRIVDVNDVIPGEIQADAVRTS